MEFQERKHDAKIHIFGNVWSIGIGLKPGTKFTHNARLKVDSFDATKGLSKRSDKNDKEEEYGELTVLFSYLVFITYAVHSLHNLVHFKMM